MGKQAQERLLLYSQYPRLAEFTLLMSLTGLLGLMAIRFTTPRLPTSNLVRPSTSPSLSVSDAR